MQKRSVTLRGHRTSITLEDEFWQRLAQLAESENISVQELVARIDETRTEKQAGNLSSAIRVYVLKAGSAG